MNLALMFLLYICLYVCSFVQITQTARRDGLKDTQQMDAYNRASRQGEDEDSSSTPEPDQNICTCSHIYDPVCASNGHSYYNLCQLECDASVDNNVTVLHQGNCIPFRRRLLWLY